MYSVDVSQKITIQQMLVSKILNNNNNNNNLLFLLSLSLRSLAMQGERMKTQKHRAMCSEPGVRSNFLNLPWQSRTSTCLLGTRQGALVGKTL